MKFYVLLTAFTLSAFASANELTVTSTAIVNNYGSSCASKGNDTEALLTQVEAKISALKGLIQQKSVVNSTPEYIPPSQHYDACAYSVYTCGGYYPGYPGSGYPNHGPGCGYVCQGGWIEDPGHTIENLRCDTTLFVNSNDYLANLVQTNGGDIHAALAAALAVGNVVYDEVDGNTHTARWVTVTQK